MKILGALLLLFANYTLAEDVCIADLKLPLQIAFVVDRTVVSERRDEWTLFQNETIYYLMPEISNRFKGSEFAVTSFSDWPNDQQSHSAEELNECFAVVQPFTTDQLELIKKVNALKQLQNQYTEGGGGGFYALMNTAATPNLQWKEDKKIRKIVIIFTDKSGIALLNNSTGTVMRTGPKGDGSDNCIDSLPPWPRFGEPEAALNSKDILVVGVFIRTDNWSVETYDVDFNYMYVPYIRYTIPVEDVRATHDFLRDFDYKNLAHSIANDIIDELQICYYSDPPAYNTLGL